MSTLTTAGITFGDATSQTTAATAAAFVTTTNVLNATAGASAGAVGTYAFLRHTTGADYAFGATLAGSSLVPAGVGAATWALYTAASASSLAITYGSYQNSAQSGTWRCMGVGSNVVDANCPPSATTAASLWLRIS